MSAQEQDQCSTGVEVPQESLPSVSDYPGGLSACLEAILMAADQPQEAADLSRILRVDTKDVEECLSELATHFANEGHGFCLQHTARGWLFASDAAYQDIVASFITDPQSSRLSQAALESLAIVAYRQPVTRAQVAGIRGVNSDGVIRTLLVRGLIREDGLDHETRASLLTTTPLFLEKMGIDSVDHLPSLAPFLPEEDMAVTEISQHLQEDILR